MIEATRHDSDWRELHRTNDAAEAVTIVTTIAAMEFDVRCAGTSPAADGDLAEAGASSLGAPPYIIEVRSEAWADLRGVLDSILDEQAQFERAYAERRERRRAVERWITVFIVLGAILTMIVALLGCAADDRASRHHAMKLLPATVR